MESKPQKAIQLEKEALSQLKETTRDNAHLISNLHACYVGYFPEQNLSRSDHSHHLK